MTTPAYDNATGGAFTGTGLNFQHTVGSIVNPITFININERNANVTSWSIDGIGCTWITAAFGWNSWNTNLGYVLGHSVGGNITIAATLDVGPAGAPATGVVCTYANCFQVDPFVAGVATASSQSVGSLGVGFTGEVDGLNIAFLGSDARTPYAGWGGQDDRIIFRAGNHTGGIGDEPGEVSGNCGWTFSMGNNVNVAGIGLKEGPDVFDPSGSTFFFSLAGIGIPVATLAGLYEAGAVAL